MIQFRVDENRCIQCEECLLDCPAGVISMGPYPQVINEEGCLQCQHCLAICPTAAISILGRNPEASTELVGNLPDPARLATLIKARRSVRRYKNTDLAPELIDTLLDISSHAPTGVNNRSVLFTVVRERIVMDRLRNNLMNRLVKLKETGKLPEGRIGQTLGGIVKVWQQEGKDIILRGAPHLLITSAPAASPCPAQDTLIALTTFQLMAHAHGVGTVWDGLFMMALAACPELPTELGIPKDHLLGYAMAFGEPAMEYHRTVQRGPARVNVVK
ncbi:MAG: nitroreductase family protein [Proteobacteria bacterium]|nr:nitroreductase family protein [Pseudomonadota bacterium]MBU1687861.1 nitroreductase family protein [Pseudomonadota bacterium]